MEKIVISVKNPSGDWASFEVHWECNTYELATVFRLIGQYLTFSAEQMNEMVPEVEE